MVFVSSGGYDTQIKKLADQMKVTLPNNATYEWYQNQRTQVFADGIEKLNGIKSGDTLLLSRNWFVYMVTAKTTNSFNCTIT